MQFVDGSVIDFSTHGGLRVVFFVTQGIYFEESCCYVNLKN